MLTKESKSVSKSQQQFMGMVHSIHKGTFHGKPSKKLKSAAKSMKKSDAKEFASTKHKGLPEKKAYEHMVNEAIIKVASPEGGAGVTIISSHKGTDESYPDSGPSGWKRKPDSGYYASGKGRIFNNKFWSGLDPLSTNDIELNQAYQSKIAGKGLHYRARMKRLEKTAARGKQSKTKGTIGDILVSRLHRSYTTAADDLYALGHMNEKERIGLSGAITGALGRFRKIGDKKFPKLMAKKVSEGDRQVVVTKTAYDRILNESIVKIAYKLQGHKTHQGIKISIENKKGSIRKGVDSDGTSWKTKMHHDYGYILHTKGKDKDHIDCFVGKSKVGQVYVIHQHNIGKVKAWKNGKCPTCGKKPANCPHDYDEDKVMLGFKSRKAAVKAYLSNYDTDLGLGPVTIMNPKDFKVEAEKTLHKPGKITNRKPIKKMEFSRIVNDAIVMKAKQGRGVAPSKPIKLRLAE